MYMYVAQDAFPFDPPNTVLGNGTWHKHEAPAYFTYVTTFARSSSLSALPSSRRQRGESQVLLIRQHGYLLLS